MSATKLSMLTSSMVLFGCPFALEVGFLFCCDSHSTCPSRSDVETIRKYVGVLNEIEVTTVLNHLKPWMESLSMYSCGLMLIQDLITRVPATKLTSWLEDMDAADMMRKKYLKQILVRISELNDADQSGRVLRKFKDYFFDLATDFRANYAMQRFCSAVSDPEDLELLATMISPYASVLGIHKHGAYVLQRSMKRIDCLFDKCSQRTKDVVGRVLLSLCQMGSDLIAHEHGNFTAQEVIFLMNRYHSVAMDFAMHLQQNLLRYCESKTATRVVEKLLEIGTENGKSAIICRMMKMDSFEFMQLYYAPSGRFVIRKALAVADEYSWNKLTKKLRHIKHNEEA